MRRPRVAVLPGGAVSPGVLLAPRRDRRAGRLALTDEGFSSASGIMASIVISGPLSERRRVAPVGEARGEPNAPASTAGLVTAEQSGIQTQDSSHG